ncbi:4Fe-4S binding protein [Mycobacterium sp. 134]|uniref:4Fe-4S binding protein n=1 Tax=Mycobacterium sp. 134 TaxID=3400425 RepID=UPI003AAF3D6E
MAYVITQNCCNDASCVAACPVGCIHPSPDEPGFAAAEMLYIDPGTCIDCGACADACPVEAIRPGKELSVEHERYRQINADYYRRHPSPATFKRAAIPRPLVTQPLRVAIVGSGPAGLYSAEALLHHPGVRVDMFDRLPFPHGLARYGVAPDHPATKAVVDQFDFSPEKSQRFGLHLGIEIGTDISHTELQQRYSAVIYATGAFHPRLLDIPGAQLPALYPPRPSWAGTTITPIIVTSGPTCPVTGRSSWGTATSPSTWPGSSAPIPKPCATRRFPSMH